MSKKRTAAERWHKGEESQLILQELKVKWDDMFAWRKSLSCKIYFKNQTVQGYLKGHNLKSISEETILDYADLQSWAHGIQLPVTIEQIKSLVIALDLDQNPTELTGFLISLYKPFGTLLKQFASNTQIIDYVTGKLKTKTQDNIVDDLVANRTDYSQWSNHHAIPKYLISTDHFKKAFDLNEDSIILIQNAYHAASIADSLLAEHWETGLTLTSIKEHKDEEFDIWNSWRDAFHTITKNSLQKLEENYRVNSELFVGRNQINEHVNRFLLESSESYFALVGESGMGKSTYLWALSKELIQQPNTAALFYDTSKDLAKNQLLDNIKSDVTNHLSDNHDFDSTFTQLSNKLAQSSIKKMTVILLDGVNETESTSLVAELLTTLHPYAEKYWFKVIISCRPKFWDNLESYLGLKSVKRNDFYSPQLGKIYVELLLPSEQEISTIYQRYQQYYNLQPKEWGLLSLNLQNRVRDPFSLSIISIICKGMNINENQDLILVDIHAIPRFLEALVQDNRITHFEIDFLIERLPKYFISLSDYSFRNHISWSDLFINKNQGNQTETERMIQILIRQGILKEDLEKQISFNFERLYGYFSGQFLQKEIDRKSNNIVETVSLYAKLINLAKSEHLFLWDPIKNALLEELITQNNQLFLLICTQKNVSVAHRSMISETLIEFAYASKRKVRTILQDLLTYKDINAALVVMEVASTLGEFDILEKLLSSRDKEVTKQIVRYIFYLWQNHPTETFELLSNWTKKWTVSLLLNLPKIKLLFEFTALILSSGQDTEKDMKSIRAIWLIIFDKLFDTPIENLSSVRKYIRNAWPEKSFSLLWPWITQNWFSEAIYDTKTFIDFYNQDKLAWHRYNKMIDYFEPNFGKIDDLKNDFIHIIESDCMIQSAVMTFLISLFSYQNDNNKITPTTHPEMLLVEDLLTYSLEKEYSVAPSVVIFLFGALANVSKLDLAESYAPEYIAIFEKSILTYYTRFECITNHGYDLGCITHYMNVYSSSDTNLPSNVIMEIIQDAFKNRKTTFLQEYIKQVTRYPKRRKPWAMLDSLKPIFLLSSIPFNQKITELLKDDLTASLNRIKIYFPKETELFIEIVTKQTKTDFMSQIKKNISLEERTEHISNMMGPTWILRDKIILNPDKFYLFALMKMMKEVPNHPNIQKTISQFLKFFVNLLYSPDKKIIFSSPNILEMRHQFNERNKI